MYKYACIKVRCGFNGVGLFNGNIYEIDDYKQVLAQKAKEGWRYVGFIPTKQRGTGHIQEMDLIFEKEIKEK